jgi:hypothetical protein
LTEFAGSTQKKLSEHQNNHSEQKFIQKKVCLVVKRIRPGSLNYNRTEVPDVQKTLTLNLKRRSVQGERKKSNADCKIC